MLEHFKDKLAHYLEVWAESENNKYTRNGRRNADRLMRLAIWLRT